MKAHDRKYEGVKSKLTADIYSDDYDRLDALAKSLGKRRAEVVRNIIRDFFTERD